MPPLVAEPVRIVIDPETVGALEALHRIGTDGEGLATVIEQGLLLLGSLLGAESIDVFVRSEPTDPLICEGHLGPDLNRLAPIDTPCAHERHAVMSAGNSSVFTAPAVFGCFSHVIVSPPPTSPLAGVAVDAFGKALRAAGVRKELALMTERTARRFRYEMAIARCAQALLRTNAENALEQALEALLDASDASHVWVDRNVIDSNLGFASLTIAKASRGREDHLGEEHSEYWDLVAWDRMPTARALFERGEPFHLVSDGMTAEELEFYNADPDLASAALNIPIMMAEVWEGQIGFADHEGYHYWGPEDVELLNAAASMIGAFWEREDAQARLTSLHRSKDEFVTAISHELRTPLTAVVGLASELHSRIDLFSAGEVVELAGFISDQGKEVAHIVDDLLVVARGDIGNVVVVPSPLDAMDHVKSAIATVAVGDRTTVLGTSSTITADPSRLRQILRNLLTNAVRYGGGAIRVELSEDEGFGVVVVSDDGPGVPADDWERIFEAYQRAHHRIGQPASVGLGLTVSRRLAELMGGSLTYSFEAGWSSFRLSLPLTS